MGIQIFQIFHKPVTETITENRVEEVCYVKLIWVKVVQKSIQLMNNSVPQLNENTHFSYLQCARLDKTSQTIATDSRRYQI